LSPTQTQTQTQTGNPIQAVFDNTADRSTSRLPGVRRALLGDTYMAREAYPLSEGAGGQHSRQLSPSANFLVSNSSLAYGIVFRFSEADPVCGPGRYDFSTLWLLLAGPSSSVSLTIQIWQNAVPNIFRFGTTRVVTGISTTPAFIGVSLPSTFTLNSAVDGVGTNYTIVLQVRVCVNYVCECRYACH
jgi:hypothetical protein